MVLESMMTDIVATFGVKDVRLKRKISNERISNGKQSDQKPSSSSSTKVSSGRSDNDDDSVIN